MGRRAKYTTASAKSAAKRAQSQNYRATSSGREARARENHKQYVRRKVMKHTLLGVPAPPELLKRAKRALCASLAVNDPGPLLGLWTPPYNFENPDPGTLDDLKTITGGETTLMLLGGLQYNKIVMDGWSRYEEWVSAEVATVTESEVIQEVAARIQGWVKLKDSLVADTDQREAEIREIALDWGAKVVCMLAEEWHTWAHEGVAVWKEHHRTGGLPWQRMMREVMRLYNTDK
ncbi:hypothetical protein C2E23DRAFT_743530 [Lenzites betulinus]|nr:hypothetical protein C2E23DRAFT_743530 [Lenzites betulinus]